MAKSIEVVVIHGSHKSTEGVAKVGDSVTLDVAELKALDPTFSFKVGKGDRFATPEAAKKLNLKRQLEEELEAPVDDETEAEAEEGAGEEPPAAEPEKPAAKKPAAKKPAAKKGKG